MAYRRVETGIWKDPWFESLDTSARYLFLYLWTNDYCNQAGLYEISIKRIMFETCLKEKELDAAFSALSEKVSRLGHWVWVKNFLRYQCCNESFLKKAITEASKAPSELFKQFCTYNNLQNTVDPHTHHTPTTHPASDTDTDTDTEQKQIQNTTSCSEPSPKASKPEAQREVDQTDTPQESSVPVIEIPTNQFATTGEQFPISQELVNEYTSLYQAVNVTQSLQAMRAWAISNPAKRKTRSGMLRFVNSWLAREQNQAGNGRHPPSDQPERVGRAGRVAMAACEEAARMRGD